MTHASFKPVDLQVNFPELEKEILKSWEKDGIVAKYLARNKRSKKYFSFLDGPITANNPMGVHHGWGRSYKDLWQRFKNMQGFRQRFQNGFDSQGLWVEVEVEKELGFKSKKDIETYGVAKFVDKCRARVMKYSAIQTEQSKRLGYFMDWDHSYYTLSDDNNYMIWNFLKKCNERGWIYKGNDSVPWCPRCETAISQHEILTEDYRELFHESVYLAFPIVGQTEEYLLVWTTTPWTIPANIAIAVDTDLDYSQIEIGKRKYWLAKEAKARVFSKEKYKELKVVKGAKLVGLRYDGAFDDIPAVKKVSKIDKFHIVIPTDDLIMPINIEEGTGLVHTAVSAGTEDFRLGKKLGLPMIPVINDDASYMEGLGVFTGQNAKKNPRIILDYLKMLEEKGKRFYFKTENYSHRYPACWRCKTELVWKVTDEWYIAMDTPSKVKDKRQEVKVGEWNDKEEEPRLIDTRTLRERMKVVAGNINWIPAFGLDREMDWLTNMHDWLISKKNRYWGLALPIWECKKCGNFEVIGSKDELKEKAVVGWKEFNGKTPHKPQIDGVKIKCSKCGGIVDRIEPVGNPWLDAGVVPFSTISDNNGSPSYLTDRKSWEKWFPADFITEGFPGQFKNWFYALIAMSTVMEDSEAFKTVLGFETLFGENGKPMHKSSGNMIEFGEAADMIGVDVMRWMYLRQNPADSLLFGYHLADEIRRKFHLKLWNVYNFFVTYANLDGWEPSRGKGLKHFIGSAVKGKNILDQWILIRLNQTIQSVTDDLEKYNAAGATNEIEKFVDDLSLWYVRRSRNRVGPAGESEKDKNAFYGTLYSVLCTLSKLMAPFTPFLSEEIFRNLTNKESVHLTDWPHFAPSTTLRASRGEAQNEKLLSEMQIARQVVEKAHAIRKEKGIGVKQPLNEFSSTVKTVAKSLEYLIRDEINVKNLRWNSKIDKLDTNITKELKEEAGVRELVHKIQDERKRLGLDLTQKVNVRIEKLPADKNIIEWMIKKAQIKNISIGGFKVTKA